MKELEFICPCCNYVNELDNESFHDGDNETYCENCGLDILVNLEVNVKVKSIDTFTRHCFRCGRLIQDGDYSHDKWYKQCPPACDCIHAGFCHKWRKEEQELCNYKETIHRVFCKDCS